MSKIIRLTSENVKRLQAVEITPQGNVVVLGGANGAGKSSVIDSIQYALGGETSDRMPVRRGEEKAKIVLDLGDIVVKRTFTAAGGTSLVVTNADNVKQVSPQAILDKLVGRLTFDPLDFSRQKPKEQAETLRGLLGLDFTAQEEEHTKLFNERTAVNRDVKALEARIAGIPKYEGLPTKEQSTAEIMAEQERAAAINAANHEARNQTNSLRLQAELTTQTAANLAREVKTLRSQIIELTDKLAKTEVVFCDATEIANNARAAVELSEKESSKLVDVDLSPFRKRAAEVEATNRKVREAKARADLVKQLRTKSDEAEKLTDRLNKIESDKRKATTQAKYPVEGLMFDAAGGVTLDGIPFEQCSQAEQLKVSIAIGLALNPKLRILLIRDGSLLDDNSMKTVLEMASKADAQVWMERVGVDAQTSVLIEDGRVAELPDTETKILEQAKAPEPEEPKPETQQQETLL